MRQNCWMLKNWSRDRARTTNYLKVVHFNCCYWSNFYFINNYRLRSTLAALRILNRRFSLLLLFQITNAKHNIVSFHHFWTRRGRCRVTCFGRSFWRRFYTWWLFNSFWLLGLRCLKLRTRVDLILVFYSTKIAQIFPILNHPQHFQACADA